MLFAVNWNDVWAMTGMGIGIVFVILILLVLVLQVFTLVAVRKGNQGKPVPHPCTSSAKRPTMWKAA